MKIAVDAMGGDYAPEEIVKGVIAGSKEHGVSIILVGPQDRIQQEIVKYDVSGASIEIVHTDNYLLEGEPPAFALRKKPDASVFVATKLVKENKADAIISAGPTGGVVTSAMAILGTLGGLSRPVVGGAFLDFVPNTIMMDLGSNIDCQPYQLLDFAVVGTVYMQKMKGIQNPTIALLSIGDEEGKGNEMVKQAYPLFKKCGLNFIGNVEGCDIPAGRANIIICDGFVGNIVVKFGEALGKTISNWIETQLTGEIPNRRMKEIIDYLLFATNAADARGGGPLWAVNGVACVAHGRAKADEIRKVIGQAKLAVEQDLVGSLQAELVAARCKLKE